MQMMKLHREEILVEISNEIFKWKSKGIGEYIITCNFNQNITKERIIKFVREINVFDIY